MRNYLEKYLHYKAAILARGRNITISIFSLIFFLSILFSWLGNDQEKAMLSLRGKIAMFRCAKFSAVESCIQYFGLYSENWKKVLSKQQIKNVQEVLCDSQEYKLCASLTLEVLSLEGYSEQVVRSLKHACQNLSGGSMLACGELGRYYLSKGMTSIGREHMSYSCRAGFNPYCIKSDK